MVAIKPASKQRLIPTKRIILPLAIVFFVSVGYYWFALVSSLHREELLLPRIRGVPQPQSSFVQQSKDVTTGKLANISDKANADPYALLAKKAQTILEKFTNLNTYSISTDARRLSKYTSNIQKECLPGRDDANGEINPTTHKNRECLRYVPKPKQESNATNSRPRIGIMATPGFVSTGLGMWIANAVKEVSEQSGNEVDILSTSHVPVYGYGKSHGYSKLIRITLQLPLAVGDAFLYEKLGPDLGEEGIMNVLEPSMLEVLNSPTTSEVETLIKLIMRWQCRLSHVSAHTSMLTLSIKDILEDPSNILQKILEFVFTNNWVWEGGGSKPWKDIYANQQAMDIIIAESSNEKSYLNSVLDETKLIQKEVEKQFIESGVATIFQSTFEEEMQRSNDMTAWPCPSFWAGVNKLKMNAQLVPDCKDGHPWIKCTVNRDRCEVNEDPECK
jgi:hypothetical protein